MSGSLPYTIDVADTQANLTATGTDYASSAPILSTLNIVSSPSAGVGIALPTDDDTWGGGDVSRVNTLQIRCDNRGPASCKVYAPDQSVLATILPGEALEFWPGGGNTFAILKMR